MKLTAFAILVLVWSGVSMGQDTAPSFEWTALQSRFQSENDLLKYADAAAKWQKDIFALSQKNESESDPNAILLLGSSSIRLWNSADSDLAPHRIIRRGYGGAKYCDLAIHAEKLLDGLQFKAVVVFVGNDISGDKLDKTPDEIARLAKLVITTIRKTQPNAYIFLVGVTPTPKRFEHWPKIVQANAALEQICRPNEGLTFVKTADHYLNKEGKPRSEYFTKDDLHQNEDGYRLWGTILKSSIEKKLATN